MTTQTAGQRDPLRSAGFSAGRFIYRNSLTLILISVGWFLASVPILTLGPATLGAYAAICSMRESEESAVNWDAVSSLVRSKFLETVALSSLPLILAGICLLYVRAFYRTMSSLNAAMAVVTFYVFGFATLVFVPAFIALARGYETPDALKIGYSWTVSNPLTAVTLGFATVFLFILTASLTIAFVLLFPAVAFSLHVELVDIDRLNVRA